MSRFTATVLTWMMTVVVAGGGTALMPMAAEAATKLSRADNLALKQAISSCKAEAKGKKIKWLERRKYVNRCVAEAVKDRPHIEVIQVLKDHPDMKGLPMEQWDAM
jgi:hypothetical protein